jgi:hypothetical protein
VSLHFKPPQPLNFTMMRSGSGFAFETNADPDLAPQNYADADLPDWQEPSVWFPENFVKIQNLSNSFNEIWFRETVLSNFSSIYLALQVTR